MLNCALDAVGIDQISPIQHLSLGSLDFSTPSPHHLLLLLLLRCVSVTMLVIYLMILPKNSKQKKTHKTNQKPQ